MKRLLALAMTTLMLLSMLSGCGSAEPSAADDENKVYDVAIIQLVTHDALDAATQGFQDALVAELVRLCKEQKVGPAYDKTSNLGPVGSKGHQKFVLDWIEKGIEEGAQLVLDGRNVKVEGYEDGYYIGHTIFDHVTEDMTIGNREVFGPVLCIKRVKSFEEGLALMNRNPFANGSVIFTQNGYYAREFAKHTDGGMVGIITLNDLIEQLVGDLGEDTPEEAAAEPHIEQMDENTWALIGNVELLEIEQTLDTLNLAFEKLLDSVFEDTALDVSSDISVLQTLLAQEGLTEDGLSQIKKQRRGETL